ncbi:Pro-Pol polyprotein [Sarcoptes scabiei]|uniref:Pro-Pol polyprotein n=1 Tax=Sarcoptes scabiei TaxID=52283 RepID=A0A834RCB8_SARSC|nr:Pro-Pol polyprotein [Sarcoptes scabiei]
MEMDQVAMFKTQNLQGIAALFTLKLELESGLVDVDGAAQSLRNITMQANRNLEMLMGLELDTEKKVGLMVTHLSNRKEASSCITEIRRMIQEKEKCQSLPSEKEKTKTSKFCKESYDDLRAFSGNPIDFPRFWALFSKKVDNTDIDDDDKLEYLLRKMDSRTVDLLKTIQNEIMRKLRACKTVVNMSDSTNLIRISEIINSVLMVADSIDCPENFVNDVLKCLKPKLPEYFVILCSMNRQDSTELETLQKEIRNRVLEIYEPGTVDGNENPDNSLILKNGDQDGRLRNPNLSSRDIRCYNCNKRGHVASNCRFPRSIPRFRSGWNRGASMKQQSSKSVVAMNQIKESEQKPEIIEDDTSPYEIKVQNALEITAKIDGNEYRFLLDTGANVNILPLKLAQELGSEIRTLKKPLTFKTVNDVKQTTYFSWIEVTIGFEKQKIKFYLLPDTINEIVVNQSSTNDRELLDKEEARNVLEYLHRSLGHIGRKQLLNHFDMQYQTRMKSDLVQQVCDQCEVCIRTKHNRRKYGLLGIVGPATRPFEIIHIDTIGGFGNLNSNKRFLHLAVDAFSRFAWALPSKTRNCKDMINLINKVLCQQTPKLIVADQYPSVKSAEFKRFLRKKNIAITFIPINHPSTNGMVERLNQTIVNRMRQKVYEFPGKAWVTLLDSCLQEYNRTIHTITKFPPEYLLYGHDPENYYQNESLDQNRRIAFENSSAAHEYSKKIFDKDRYRLNFKPGDEIFVEIKNRLNRQKLDPIYEGPFTVQEQISDTIVRIDRDGKLMDVHVSKCKSLNFEKH